MKITLTDKTAEPISVGQFYKYDRNIYFLAQCDENIVCLICLGDGNRFLDGVRVGNSSIITSDEFAQMYNTAYDAPVRLDVKFED